MGKPWGGCRHPKSKELVWELTRHGVTMEVVVCGGCGMLYDPNEDDPNLRIQVRQL